VVPNPELDVNLKHATAVTGQTLWVAGKDKIIHKCFSQQFMKAKFEQMGNETWKFFVL